MNGQNTNPTDDAARDFERAASARTTGLFVELWRFLRANKKWWLLPILIAFLGLGALLVLSSTAVAPFIYTLF